MTPPASEYAAHARTWAARLREGSSLTWSEFLADVHQDVAETDPSESRAALPAAGQLEVIRLLAAGQGELPDFAGLADLILDTDAPGRGLVDIPLPWPGAVTRFGTPALAPENLPRAELIRVLAAALVRQLIEEPVEPEPPERRTWRPGRKRFRLHGAPETVRVFRQALLARGLREGSGGRATHLVLAGPLEQLMAERWVARIEGGAAMRWQRMWRHAQVNDRLPPAIRIAGRAESLARGCGPANVHVVIAECSQDLMEQVGGILGLPGPLPTAARTHRIVAADLLRVLNPLLVLAAGESRRNELVQQVWPHLVTGQSVEDLGAPRAQLDWAVHAGEQMVERLHDGRARAGYAVHGDPAAIVPRQRPGVLRSVPQREVVELGLRAVGRAWARGVERKN